MTKAPRTVFPATTADIASAVEAVLPLVQTAHDSAVSTAAADATAKDIATKNAAAADATTKANVAKAAADTAAAQAATAKQAADAAKLAADSAPTAAAQAAAATQSVRVAADLAGLRAAERSANILVLLMGKTGGADGLGGTYYWDAASTDAEDLAYLNTVAVSGITTGRWKRLSTRVTVLPQGILTVNGGVKTLYATATVAGTAGQAALNLTTNNVATGPAIFTEIWDNKSSVKPPAVASTVEDNINCDCQSEATDLKTTVHVATRGSKTTLPAVATALLGLVITSQRYAPAGTVLRITVIGI